MNLEDNNLTFYTNNHYLLINTCEKYNTVIKDYNVFSQAFTLTLYAHSLTHLTCKII